MQQRCDPRRPIPPVHRRQLDDPLCQRILIITRDRRVTMHRTVLPEHTARTTLRDAQHITGVIHRAPPLARAQ
jgi:hypothetical protein